MQTYSHFLLTAVLRRKINRKKKPPANATMLVGSVAPDVPLALLSLGYIIDRRFVHPDLPNERCGSPAFNDLYFNNRWWIAAHNIFHAPLPIFAFGLLGFANRRRAWGRALLWFAVGCGLHTAVDIFTHADDGPVITFPLEWHTRFHSPVSYWDEAHYGRVFRILEHSLDLLLILYLVYKKLTARNLRKTSSINRKERREK